MEKKFMDKIKPTNIQMMKTVQLITAENICRILFNYCHLHLKTSLLLICFLTHKEILLLWAEFLTLCKIKLLIEGVSPVPGVKVNLINKRG